MLAQLADVVLADLTGVLDAVFFKHALEHANQSAGITCRTVVPSVLHVLDELFALGLEIRDLNNGLRPQTIVPFDSSVPR
ncbi:hypothetical protein [Rhizobium leguminosarum]|uniref:hypothetical protein n=1 Tax=Rhizobium leguminosarum TaxID=384 RepID=UPI003F959875